MIMKVLCQTLFWVRVFDTGLFLSGVRSYHAIMGQICLYLL